MPVGNEYRNGLRCFFSCFFFVSQICKASSKSDASQAYINEARVAWMHVGFDFSVRNFKIINLYFFYIPCAYA